MGESHAAAAEEVSAHWTPVPDGVISIADCECPCHGGGGAGAAKPPPPPSPALGL